MARTMLDEYKTPKYFWAEAGPALRGGSRGGRPGPPGSRGPLLGNYVNVKQPISDSFT